MGFYFFLNSPKNLDPSDKMDLDLCDCLGRVELVFYQNFIGLIESFVVFYQNFIGLIESFVVILERGKARLTAEYIR